MTQDDTNDTEPTSGFDPLSTTDRQMSWYTIRHSIGTYMTREEDLAAAFDELRDVARRDEDEQVVLDWIDSILQQEL